MSPCLLYTSGWTGHIPAPQQEAISIDELIERLPDAFIALDKTGVIRRANRAFLDMVEVGTKGSRCV